MQPRNGRKLDVAAFGGTRAAWKTTLRRVVTPGPTGLPVSPRNQTSTSAVATRASVPATTYPCDGAGELVVDPSRRDDDPRAGDGQAHAQPLALVGGPGAPGRQRSEERSAEDDGERERAAADHNGLRVHASERPDATSRKTTPTPANAAVTSRFSRLEPIRLPRSL